MSQESSLKQDIDQQETQEWIDALESVIEEDGIRDPLWSRGLGDVYKRQTYGYHSYK